MKKILSIIIPVYNTEKYIRRCLDSVLLTPVLNDIEVLVISDGSPDNSVKIIKEEYLNKYHKSLRLIEKENGGHGSTINKGIEVASGKYFKVLDSDDWVNATNFIKFVKKLKSEDADLVVTNYSQEHIYNCSRNYYRYEKLKENKIYDFEKINLEDLKGEYFVMATSTYKLDVLKSAKVKLLEKTFYVDMQYNILPIPTVKNFVYYDMDIYKYYIGRKDQSTNIQSYVKNKKDHEKVMKNLLEFYSKSKNKLSKNKEKYIRQILIYMLYTHYNIFCCYDKNYNEAYYQIKEFDDYFKKINKDLYISMNEMSLIKAHRKTKFKFVKIQSKFIKKIFNNTYKIIGM